MEICCWWILVHCTRWMTIIFIKAIKCSYCKPCLNYLNLSAHDLQLFLVLSQGPSPNIHVFIIDKDMASVFYCSISYMATKLLCALYTGVLGCTRSPTVYFNLEILPGRLKNKEHRSISWNRPEKTRRKALEESRPPTFLVQLPSTVSYSSELSFLYIWVISLHAWLDDISGVG